MIMAVASPQVELLISLFFSEDDVDFSYVSYISTSGITTLHTLKDIFLEKLKNHANNLIGDHIISFCVFMVFGCHHRFHSVFVPFFRVWGFQYPAGLIYSHLLIVLYLE